MRNSKAYVLEYLDFLSSQNIERVLLPDTLGVLTPEETFAFITEVREKFPTMHIDFHGHNDYDLGVANVMQALHAGTNGLHLTINGM